MISAQESDLNLPEDSGQRTVLQVVGKRVDISMDRDWTEKPCTRIVVIGAAGSFSLGEMKGIFDHCLALSLPHRFANS